MQTTSVFCPLVVHPQNRFQTVFQSRSGVLRPETRVLNCFWMASPRLNAAAAWQTHLQSSFGGNRRSLAANQPYMLRCRLTDTALNDQQPSPLTCHYYYY